MDKKTETIPGQQELTRNDFKLDQPVKWCAGCGDYAILSAVQNALPEIGMKKENIVFVSGIGCSSRFPYYINTYGFHGLHGRAAAVATGIKIANPELSVWMVTGDGDSMAIGGNHFIHILRRNIDVNILIFNNRIYGLTKGQYSPTSPKGLKTKTSPDGTIEPPFIPGELAMGAQGTFFARALDTEPRQMTDIFIKAARHDGTSVVEILQNCVIFNNKIHQEITGKDVKDDRIIYLEHGKPMIFGINRDKGLVLQDSRLKVVHLGEEGITEDDLLVHDAYTPDIAMHYMLTRMAYPEFPVATGVIRSFPSEPYDQALERQVIRSMEESKIKTLEELINTGNVWQI
ncbi:MAG: 2-oxoacid:ferredoxin oxidoreductase subunit beta [Lentimicrobiaceae bacterium]|nr:2-oxoacid:ferredoxin oxidoreductase subunit beta [Lentimicrobiaceae bacterium]